MQHGAVPVDLETADKQRRQPQKSDKNFRRSNLSKSQNFCTVM